MDLAEETDDVTKTGAEGAADVGETSDVVEIDNAVGLGEAGAVGQ